VMCPTKKAEKFLAQVWFCQQQYCEVTS